MWQNAAGSAVRTLEDIGCSTKLFWQQCGHRSLTVAQSLYLTMSYRYSLSHLLLFGAPLPAALCLQPRRLISLSSNSFSLPYVILPHLPISIALSLTCSLSHASAQPSSFPSFFHHSADSAYPSPSHLHHFSSLSHSAYFEALLPDLIKAPCCSLPSSEIQDVGQKTF